MMKIEIVISEEDINELDECEIEIFDGDIEDIHATKESDIEGSDIEVD